MCIRDSYATVWSNAEVLLMAFIGALGGVLLGAIPGMTATMGVALLDVYKRQADYLKQAATDVAAAMDAVGL